MESGQVGVVTKIEKDPFNVSLVKYDLTDKRITELQDKYKDVVILPGDKDAYAMVKAGWKEIVQELKDVEKWHKDGKAPFYSVCKKFDNEKKRIFKLESLKDTLRETYQAEDNRIKQEEEERLAGIWDEHIKPIQDAGARLTGLTLDELRTSKAFLQTLVLSDEKYKEFEFEALEELDRSEKALDEAIKTAEEKERLARQKEEQDKQAAILKEQQDKLDAENKRIADANAKLEADKKSESDRKEREAFEAQAKENARIKAESDAAEKVKQEAKDKADKEEADRVEKERLESLKPEKEKCILYIRKLLEITPPVVEDKSLEKQIKRVVDGLNNVHISIEGVE